MFDTQVKKMGTKKIIQNFDQKYAEYIIYNLGVEMDKLTANECSGGEGINGKKIYSGQT